MCPVWTVKDVPGKNQDGAVTANADELAALVSYPHDTIEFSQNPAVSSLAEFRQLYLKGLSLNEVSEVTGFAVSTIRDLLIRNNVTLRAANKSTASDPKKPKRTFWGAIPYGYNILDGQVVVDPKEIKVVRKILELHRKGLKFNAIKRWLNDQKIPSKLSSKWNDKTVASIIRSHLKQSEQTKKGVPHGPR